MTISRSALGVSVSQAGLLITAFAIGMIMGSPVMAITTLRLPRRSTLVLALAVFAVGHVIAALSSSFAVVFAARVLTALATGAFWSVASVVAAAAAPAAGSRALERCEPGHGGRRRGGRQGRHGRPGTGRSLCPLTMSRDCLTPTS